MTANAKMSIAPYTNTKKQAGQLVINLLALQNNYRLCQEQVGAHCEIGAAVKADAYGIGVAEAAPALYAAGCRSFFVATLGEGVQLRSILPDHEARICVLGGLQPDAEEIFDFHTLTPVLNSYEQIERWMQYSKRTRPHLKCIIHIDTGMARLGLCEEETQKLKANMTEITNTLDVEAVMSHFACADEKGHPLNDLQLQRFQNASDSFLFAKKSLANSSGIFRGSQYHFDLARPGMCLYGLNPTPETENPMQEVVSLDVPLLQTRSIKKGESAGYGASWVADKDTLIGTVQIGYADGFFRTNSNHASTLYWHNYKCPVVGRVSMDVTIVSLENIPEGMLPVAGDLLEVIGPHQSADDLALSAGTIGYEILTSLGRRYARTYLK